MDVLVARQPIFDKKLQVFGYELLYRGLMGKDDKRFDGDRATSEVIINSFQILDIDSISSNKVVFINFTEKLIKDKVPSFLSNEKVIVEILEDIHFDSQMVEACKELKEKGYVLALDDFIFEDLPSFNAVLPFIDIIKVDILQTNFSDVKIRIMKTLLGKKKKFLAEKVETYQQYQSALELGFEYFQGYFFEKPYVIVGKEIESYQITYLQMIAEIQASQSFDKLADIVNRDIGLSYKLLRLINSPFYGRGCKIKSTKEALIMLGLQEVKKWLMLLMLRESAKEKPDELMRMSLVRAKFAENISPLLHMEGRKAEFFLLGLFSTLDAILDKPMEEIVQYIPFEDDLLAAYQKDSDSIFYKVVQIIKLYEKGQWDKADRWLEETALSPDDVNERFFNSIIWADHILETIT